MTTSAQTASTTSASSTASTTTEFLILTGQVIVARGGDVAWNAPVELQDSQLANPGQRNYTLEGVPDFMLGGLYIGSRTWPKGAAWDWIITYIPPVRLYIWAIETELDAGIR